jgi:hypothetical protein
VGTVAAVMPREIPSGVMGCWRDDSRTLVFVVDLFWQARQLDETRSTAGEVCQNEP